MRRLENDLKHLAEADAKRRIDPTAAVWILFLLLMEELQQSELAPLPGSDAFKRIAGLVLKILARVDALLRLEFWETLEFDQEIPTEIIPDTHATRAYGGMLRAHVRQLQDASAGLEDIQNALDFAQECVGELSQLFSAGLIADGARIDDSVRFHCASILSTLHREFKTKWVPLRRAIAGGGKSEKSRSIPTRNRR